MSWPAPVTLRGAHASLVPLDPVHAAALAEALSDGELWKLWYTAIPAPEQMGAEIERRLLDLRPSPPTAPPMDDRRQPA